MINNIITTREIKNKREFMISKINKNFIFACEKVEPRAHKIRVEEDKTKIFFSGETHISVISLF